ncbi:hypothetical protein GTY70_05865 [Stenotrophomonas maltophilia]|uniref:hypothetical protein n=1 Tax=Stenotrophomonas pavanii TaxID=487698 RepID=UPI001F1E261D|nr:hypothetical protein [Stenotrophomonas pavanii]MCF3463408.1 hypothetical protein [Stenotrophomonas maltophilia]MCF3507925.1 hypothetical protein [Stenotrophomonas maltophilia]MCU1155802.1 hypothetical protein [Stenotrophomonas maltophilia]MCU1166993.1 hypothetical protein [Stenotrophomonas maltophilia]MCU1213283.1 hypothetical protein [Stenotrophomonas maltophilia]
MIAFIGWGSLIWDPRELPIVGHWQTDGPEVRVEFQRQSADGRLTLVLSPDALLVTSLWAKFDGTDLSEARAALASREGVSPRNANSLVGVWRRGDASPECLPGLSGWAERKSVSGVVWTALPPKLAGKVVETVTSEEALSYLSSLTGTVRASAEEYVRRTPGQIATRYRTRIEETLGWRPL